VVSSQIDGSDHPGLVGASGVDDPEPLPVVAQALDRVGWAGPVVAGAVWDPGPVDEKLLDLVPIDVSAVHAAAGVGGELEGMGAELGEELVGRVGGGVRRGRRVARAGQGEPQEGHRVCPFTSLEKKGNRENVEKKKSLMM
jgi:hypothetical protein